MVMSFPAGGATGQVAGSDPTTPASRSSRADEASVPVAVGLLMERHRIGQIAAHAMLAEVARERGVEQAKLAGALIALLSPAPGDASTGTADGSRALTSIQGGSMVPDAWQLLEESPQIGASAVDGMVRAVAMANEDGDAAAQFIADLTGARPDRTVIYSVGEDKALFAVGNAGTPADVIQAWQKLPLTLEIPLCVTVAERRPIFLESAEEMEGAYPATRGSREGTEAWASIPIVKGARVLGAVGLSWLAPTTLEEGTRARILRAVERAGPIIVQSMPRASPAPTMLAGLMHLIPDPWMVLSPTDASWDGSFLIDAVAPNLPDTWLGRDLLDAFPGLAGAGDLMTDLRQVLHSGSPLVRTISSTHQDGPPWEESGVRLRVIRSGRFLVLTWR